MEDMAASMEFYQSKLGFTLDFAGDGPLFAMLRRDNLTVMLRKLEKGQLARPNRVAFIEAG